MMSHLQSEVHKTQVRSMDFDVFDAWVNSQSGQFLKIRPVTTHLPTYYPIKYNPSLSFVTLEDWEMCLSSDLHVYKMFSQITNLYYMWTHFKYKIFLTLI